MNQTKLFSKYQTFDALLATRLFIATRGSKSYG